jgi:hypothetical protein
LSPDPCGDCVDRCSLRSHGCEEERKGFSFLSFFLLSFVCDEWIKKHSTRDKNSSETATAWDKHYWKDL